MITKPSMAQLLLAMQAELTEKIVPALTDATLVVNVQMMTAVLGAVAIRAEHELAWMRDEADSIERAALDLLDHHLGQGPKAEAAAACLALYRADLTSSLHLSEAQGDYDRAGELLSRLAEAAYDGGDDHAIAAVEALMEERLATEQRIVGSFIAVGRD